MKQCVKCKKFKTQTMFGKRRKNRDGLKSHCKQCGSIYRRQHYEKNKARVLKLKKIYYYNNRTKELAQNKAYRQSERGKEKRRKRQKIRLNTDFKYRLIRNHRCRIWHAVKGISKEQSSKDLLGCNNQEYKEYLTKQFLPEMTIENYGTVWEVDHMKPCSSFDLTDEEERKKCFHFTNTQPMFISENKKKSNKIIYDMDWDGSRWRIK